MTNPLTFPNILALSCLIAGVLLIILSTEKVLGTSLIAIAVGGKALHAQAQQNSEDNQQKRP